MARKYTEPPVEKLCSLCGVIKPASEFRIKSSKYPYRLDPRCRPCFSKYKRELHLRNKLRNPHKIKAKDFQYNLSRKKLTLEEFNKMLQTQDNKCAICNAELPDGRGRAIDHCHKTGRIRGVLCSNCNTAIGLLKEDTTRFLNAINYLEKYKVPNDLSNEFNMIIERS